MLMFSGNNSTVNTNSNSCRYVYMILNYASVFLLCINPAFAILPTAELYVRFDLDDGFVDGSGALGPDSNRDNLMNELQSYNLLVSQGSFGADLPMAKRRGYPDDGLVLTPVRAPEDDPLLCNEADGVADYRKFVNGDVKSVASERPYNPATSSVVMLIPRGKCTFENKALSAQRLGVSAVIIYGTLASRYSLNETRMEIENENIKKNEKSTSKGTVDDIIWPYEFLDYDCNMWRTVIPTNQLSFLPLPYNSVHNDPLLSGNATMGNLCAYNQSGEIDTDFYSTCPSRRCLLTGRPIDSEINTNVNMAPIAPDVDTSKPLNENKTDGVDPTSQPFMEACCAWDNLIYLYAAPDDHQSEPVTVPTVYITMEQAFRILLDLDVAPNNTMSILMHARYEPTYNIGAYLCWMLGVSIAALAAYCSAEEYRYYRDSALLRQFRSHKNQSTPESNHDQRIPSKQPQNHLMNSARSRSRSISPTTSSQHPQDGNSINTSHTNIQIPATSTNNNDHAVEAAHAHNKDEETLELTVHHAIGFMICSTVGLLTLFYLKIYALVKVMYGLACSSAIMTIIIDPLFYKIYQKFNKHQTIHCSQSVTDKINMLSFITSYGIGITWIYISLTVRHPDEHAFYWIMQDIMGACMCISFLSTIKLPGIKVATVLLTTAFFYDIFMVFITPLLTKGGKSIMIDVATSGGPPTADPSWCEKYPETKECQGGDPLPMLLTVPRFGDYRGGSSLLGLGDIVLPGLLLSFAARCDEAERFIREVYSRVDDVPKDEGLVCVQNFANSNNTKHDNIWNNLTKKSQNYWSYGYFFPLCLAYAVGLAMADIAVYIMQMGQPALLYLVPCCLGTFIYISWKRRELSDMWEDGYLINYADSIVKELENEYSQYRHGPESKDDNYVANQNSSSSSHEERGNNNIISGTHLDDVDDNCDNGSIPLLKFT